MKRITAVQQIFADVDPTSLENWIQDFKRDMNPDRELAVWESMAAAYSRYNSEKKLSQPERKELYGILLTGSGASVDEAIKHLKLKVFTEADARNALRILSEEWSKHRQ